MQSELLRQLQKDDNPHKDHMGDAALMQLLRIQGNDYNSRKRSHNEADDGSGGDKRPENRPSKLREKNKMLASLLANPAKAPSQSYNTPTIKVMPDITRVPNAGQPQSTLPQQQQQQQQLQQHQQQQILNQKLIGLQQQQSLNRAQQQQQQQQQVRKPSDVYLNQQMPTQQELNKNAQVI